MALDNCLIQILLFADDTVVVAQTEGDRLQTSKDCMKRSRGMA